MSQAHIATPVRMSSERKKELAKKLQEQREKDNEMVKGIFKFYEVPGGRMEFVLQLNKEDGLQQYDMIDGQIYTVPRGTARHLNTTGWYPVHAHTTDEHGKPSMKIGTKVRRYGFQSLEFTDLDEPRGKELITVEYAG